MSVGPMGMMGSVAGSHLAQTKGADVEKAQQDTTDQSRQAEFNTSAESAAGVGETEEDQETSDRDADGRRLWESPQDRQSGGPNDTQQTDSTPCSKDPSGQRGTHLDLTG